MSTLEEKETLIGQAGRMSGEFLSDRYFSWPTMIEQVSSQDLPTAWRTGVIQSLTKQIEEHGIDGLIAYHPATEKEHKNLRQEGITRELEINVIRARILDAAVELAGPKLQGKQAEIAGRAIKAIFPDVSTDELEKWPDKGLHHVFFVHTKSLSPLATADPGRLPDRALSVIMRNMKPTTGAQILADVVTLDVFGRIGNTMPIGTPTDKNTWYWENMYKKRELPPDDLANRYAAALVRNDKRIEMATRNSAPHFMETIQEVERMMVSLVRKIDAKFDDAYTKESANTFFEKVCKIWGRHLELFGSIYKGKISDWTRHWWNEYGKRPGVEIDRPAVIFALLNLSEPDQENGVEVEMHVPAVAKSVLQLLSDEQFMTQYELVFRDSADNPLPEGVAEKLQVISKNLMDNPKLEQEIIYIKALPRIFDISSLSIVRAIGESKLFQGGQSRGFKESLLRTMFENADQNWWTGGLDRETESPNEALADVYALTKELGIDPMSLWEDADEEIKDALNRLESL